MKMLVRVGMMLVAVVGMLGGVGRAQAGSSGGKRPMTFADLQAMKRVSDPQISPSGKWVMFSVTDVSLEKNSKTNHLWVVAVAGGAKEAQVTFGDGESNGRFAPDGKTVSLTMKGQIFVAPWNEAEGRVGKAVQVTNVAGGADGAIWSPDSKRLMFVASVYPECSDTASWADEDTCDKTKDAAAEKSPVKAQVFEHLLYRHWNAWTGEKRSHVLVVDAADGRRLRDLTPRSVVGDAETPTFSLGGPLGYAWAPDSKEIAYVTNLEKVPAVSTNNDVFTLRLDEVGARARKVSTSPGSDDGPAYSPDGKWLAWRSQARNGFESDLFRLVVMDRASGTIKDMLPRYTNQRNEAVEDNWVDGIVWGPESRTIAYMSPSKGEEPIYVVGLGETTSGNPERRVLAIEGEFSDAQIAPDGKTVIASKMTVDHPSEIVVITHEEQREKGYDVGVNLTHVRSLTSLNGSLLSQLSLSKLEPFWFKGAGGTDVEGFIVKPPNFDAAKKYPVKFLMHGGPQTAWGDAWSYRWNWELMAASGYVVVGVNRRGSTGYGQKFVEEVSGDWGGRAYEDLMKGLDYAEAHYSFIDKTRECALGASYGGYMANWVLTHTDRFKCIVTHDGLYNPQSAFGTTEELWFNEWEFRPLAAAARVKQIPGGNGRQKNNGNGEKQVPGGNGRQKNNGNGEKQVPGGNGRQKNNDNGEKQVPGGNGRQKNKSDGSAEVAGVVEQGKPALPNEADPFRKWSPMLHIRNAHTPTLVIHSQRDYRLDVSEGFQLFTALQLLGVPSKMLYFPDEGHWVLKPQNSQLWYETVGDWCDRWTGMGKYADVGPEKNPVAVKKVVPPRSSR
jgi:dipeptidyl aminopeptidase/acylaminoacyl peptidase